MPPRPARRGHRSALATAARIPSWARDLVATLSLASSSRIREHIRALRWVIEALERVIRDREADGEGPVRVNPADL